MTGEPQGVVPGTISFVFGHPDPVTLPVDLLKAAADKVLCGPEARLALQYGPERGVPALVDYLAEKLNREEGLALTSEHMMLTAGSTHAVDMIAQLYGGCGEVVLVEAPSYADALHVFRDQGLEMRAVPVDEGGLVIEALVEQLAALQSEGRTPRFLYTIPSFQNPSGVTLTQARRETIVALAREHGFLIVEDDVYRDLAFEGQIPPSFYALSEGKGVLRIGSFSKIMAAGLRLGWLVGSREHIKRCAGCGVMQMGGGANPLTAHMVKAFCEAGHLAPHIIGLREVYRCRCEVMLNALAEHMPDGVSWTQPRGGFFVWLTLPHGLHVEQVQKAARMRGVHFTPGMRFFAGEGGTQHLRLAFSFVVPEEMVQGVAALGEAIQALI